MLLPCGWYAIAASNELKSNKPLGIERFGKFLVLWRKADGSPVAMLDQCPHRSAKLSIGVIKNESIECPFHGFCFESTGSCVLVPETKKAALNLKVETFPIEERHGFLWVFHGKSADGKSPPWFDALAKPGWSFSQQVTEWPTHITRSIENQLDYAHLPYVHRNTIGGNLDVTKPVKFESTDEYIRFAPGGSDGSIEFRFPNIWMLTILPGRFAQMMAFVPVNENTTRLYLRGYQSFVKLPGLDTIFNTIGAWQSKYILSQDRAVVLSQHPLQSSDANHEALYPSDEGIKMFRRRWIECQE